MNDSQFKLVMGLIDQLKSAITESAAQVPRPSDPDPDPATSSNTSGVIGSHVSTPTKQTGYVLSAKSLRELKGVNPDLVKCVWLALTRYSTIDFTVFDGIRTPTEQAKYVRNGTSETMKSKHLDGLAVDLVPIINGIPKWDWNGCYEVARAMYLAAQDLGLLSRITWGGAWDVPMSKWPVGVDPAEICKMYQTRHPGPDFIDGPHFEILP